MTNYIEALITKAMKNAIINDNYESYAPSNIALSKYWGKRDQGLNLPFNSSLSISLNEWGTRTKISVSQDGKDHIALNGDDLDINNAFSQKILSFINLFRQHHAVPLKIETFNSIPTAAGLASSASGFSALTQAICGFFTIDETLGKNHMSLISRIGSGSATRSFWHGFVKWDKGHKEDGSDSFAHPLTTRWPEFRIAIIPVDVGPKSFSSRDGMNHTVTTSPLFQSWPSQAEIDCRDIEEAVVDKNFNALGALAEANALAMHATMQAARPALCYLNAMSWGILEKLHKARSEGLEAYATMDAGANVKLIFLEQSSDDISALFKNAQIIKPF